MKSVEEWKNEIAACDATYCSAERAAASFILQALDQQRPCDDLANALQGMARLYQEHDCKA